MNQDNWCLNEHIKVIDLNKKEHVFTLCQVITFDEHLESLRIILSKGPDARCVRMLNVRHLLELAGVYLGEWYHFDVGLAQELFEALGPLDVKLPAKVVDGVNRVNEWLRDTERLIAQEHVVTYMTCLLKQKTWKLGVPPIDVLQDCSNLNYIQWAFALYLAKHSLNNWIMTNTTEREFLFVLACKSLLRKKADASNCPFDPSMLVMSKESKTKLSKRSNGVKKKEWEHLETFRTLFWAMHSYVRYFRDHFLLDFHHSKSWSKKAKIAQERSEGTRKAEDVENDIIRRDELFEQFIHWCTKNKIRMGGYATVATKYYGAMQNFLEYLLVLWLKGPLPTALDQVSLYDHYFVILSKN